MHNGSQTARAGGTQTHGPGTEEMRVLRDFLSSDSNFHLASIVSQCNPPELAEMSDALICAYELMPHGRERLLYWSSTRHVRECGEQSETLFRGTSLETKIISTYLHKRCADFVRASVTPLLNWLLLEGSATFEVDPAKEPSQEKRAVSQKKLIEAAQLVISTVVTNTPLIPEEVCSVLRSIQSTVQSKFPAMGLRSVGSLIFLRLLCPAMVSPDTFLNFRKGTPQMRRSLILISKLVQNLANVVLFGDKEEYLLFANDWLQQSSQVYQQLIFDIVQGVRVKPQEPTFGVVSAVEQDLAMRWVRNFLCVHRRAVQDKHIGDLFQGAVDARKQSGILLMQLRSCTNSFKPVTQPDMPPSWREALGLDKSVLARSMVSMRESVENVVKRASTTNIVPAKQQREDATPSLPPASVAAAAAEKRVVTTDAQEDRGGEDWQQELEISLEGTKPKLVRKNSTISARMKLARRSVMGISSIADSNSNTTVIRRRQRDDEEEGEENHQAIPMELSTPVNLSPLKKAKQRDSAEEHSTYSTPSSRRGSRVSRKDI